MASTLFRHALFFIVAIFSRSWIARASDPNILSDFLAPESSNTPIDANFFTFTAMRSIFATNQNPANFTVTKASLKEFPALDGQSVSMAVLQFPADGVNPPHTHPRAAELLFVVEGSLEVGFVDTTSKLYSQQTLQTGDMFLFPKGLVHFQYNPSAEAQATAVSAFGSANAGTASLPANLFTAGIADAILAKAFKTDVATIQKIKAGLGAKP